MEPLGVALTLAFLGYWVNNNETQSENTTSNSSIKEKNKLTNSSGKNDLPRFVARNRKNSTKKRAVVINHTNINGSNQMLNNILDRPESSRSNNQRSKEKIVFSKLTGLPIKEEEFTHNNMVPFFGSNVKQNTSEYANNQILENYTGVSNYSISKSEIEPMFDPSNNSGNVYGTPNIDSEMYNRYIPSRYKQDQKLMDPIKVGPGLDQGYTSKPSGGFHQADTRKYIIPKTTNDLRVKNNPKNVYKGRIIPGKAINSKRTMISKVSKNLPETYQKHGPDRYFTTVGAVRKKTKRGKFVDKKTNRQNTSKSYTGPAGPSDRVKPKKRGEYMKSTKNTYKTSGPRNVNINGEWHNQKIGDYGKSNVLLSEQERATTEDKTILSNFSSVVKAMISPFADILKPSKKENFVGSIRPSGNVQVAMPGKMTIYDPNDVARTTIKETNIHNNNNGNLIGPKKLTIYDPNDIAKKTIKETNIHDNRIGNINRGVNKTTIYDPNDIARTTIKETNIHDNRAGNINRGVRKATIYDPNDVTRTTIKETNIHDNRTGNINRGVSKATIYDPNDVTRTTIKETNIHDNRTGNINRGVEKMTVYDPNDIARTTIKETNIHDNRTGNIDNIEKTGIVWDPEIIAKTTVRETLENEDTVINLSKQGPSNLPVHDPCDVAKTTIKETNIENKREGNYSRSDLVKEGYSSNPKFAPNTNRQFTSNNDYTGLASGDTMGGGGDGYQTAEYHAPNTNKQFTSEKDYTGIASTQDANKPMSYQDIYNATMNNIKTEISTGREPTLSNVKFSSGEENVKICIKKKESDIVNERKLIASRVYNSIPQKNMRGVTSIRDTFNSATLEERINPNILDTFKKNPYTKPLSSFGSN
jgi:hypothetical protein